MIREWWYYTGLPEKKQAEYEKNAFFEYKKCVFSLFQEYNLLKMQYMN